MIDLERGLISRDIFARDDIFNEEQEKLFTRAWLFVGHESLIPEAGDYFLSRMGTESVIVSRDRARQIHVLLNTCRHRGMKVCLYDQGNTLGSRFLVYQNRNQYENYTLIGKRTDTLRKGKPAPPGSSRAARSC